MLKRRFSVFRRDVREHWFPCKCGSTEVDIKTKRMEALLRKQRDSRFLDPESLPAAVPRRLSSVGLPGAHSGDLRLSSVGLPPGVLSGGDRAVVPEILRTGSRRRERRRSDGYYTSSRRSNPWHTCQIKNKQAVRLVTKFTFRTANAFQNAAFFDNEMPVKYYRPFWTVKCR